MTDCARVEFCPVVSVIVRSGGFNQSVSSGVVSVSQCHADSKCQRPFAGPCGARAVCEKSVPEHGVHMGHRRKVHTDVNMLLNVHRNHKAYSGTGNKYCTRTRFVGCDKHCL